MEKIENTYYAYAKNDSDAVKSLYNDGHVYNCMASMAQNCCEKYLKHIIQEYDNPDSPEKELAQTKILKTHSIKSLLHYISENMNIKIDRADQNEIKLVDGYYFSARYPGNESFFPTKEDIDECMQAIESCEKITKAIIAQKENEKISPIDLEPCPFEKISNNIEKEDFLQKDNIFHDDLEL